MLNQVENDKKTFVILENFDKEENSSALKLFLFKNKAELFP